MLERFFDGHPEGLSVRERVLELLARPGTPGVRITKSEVRDPAVLDDEVAAWQVEASEAAA